ncbi:serine kinase [Nioella nitratireducens]|uniref:serine kinase n=1 Tax=Nioella nitratireducens TaxID=1287720 RepID=UPI001F457D16|nr:serine kinase [Nioella nitratireducens]
MDALFASYTEAAPDGRLFCRGTGVALNGQGVLILGASGRGKTRLAFELLALGADLLADDGVWLDGENRLIRPDTAPALIEARGVGLLRARPIQRAQLVLVVNLDRADPDRLPPRREVAAPGGAVPLILGRDHPFLAPVLHHLLQNGRAE